MPEARVFDYAAAVTRQPLGSYAMVDSSTASPTFSGFATVTELLGEPSRMANTGSIFASRPQCLTLEPVRAPGDERLALQRITAPTHAAVHPLRLAVEELPTAYPTMAGIEQDHTRTRPFGPPEPVFRFVDDDGKLRSLADVGVRPIWSEGVSGDFVVRPQVGDAATAPPSEFLTLWALLFCLSELARYYPDTWVCALDPDRSPAAVTIEHGLELALERTPAMISEAWDGPIAHLMRDDSGDAERKPRSSMKNRLL